MKIKNKIIIFICIILIFNLTIKNLHAETPLYILNAIKLNYKDNNKIIIAEGKASAKDQFGKEIYSDFIIYDKINNLIKTKSNSKYKDTKGNEIDADDFFYDLNIKKIKAINNVKYKEKTGNIFLFSEFEFFENSSRGFGKNVKGLLTDKSSFESRFAEIDNNADIVTIKTDTKKISLFDKLKSLFNDENKYTTCENLENKKNIKEQCPDWSFSTYQTTQDSKKKMVYHEHAVLKIRNIPVFYTPYFSHPDPSVSRKSGFLMPSTKNFSNLGRTYKIPYFWAISNDLDLTFNPVIMPDEHNIYHSTLRKQNHNSKIYLDTSYSEGYKNLDKKKKDGSSLNRTGGSRNHIFLNYYGKYDNIIFDKNDVIINIERISQKNYLKVNEINNEFINQDITNLKNEISINSYKEKEKLEIAGVIYENLGVEDPNSKYQYTFPKIRYKKYFNIKNQLINLSNSFKATNYDGDSKQALQINNVSIDGPKKTFEKIGIISQIKTNLNNINTYNDAIASQKQDFNSDIYPTIALNNSLPLWKVNQFNNEKLTPSIFAKYTLGKMNNNDQTEKILSQNDIFSMNRLYNQISPETGASAGYGIEYENSKKNDQNKYFLKNRLFIGQVISDTRKIYMPESSSLNNKQSDFVGSASFSLDNSKKNSKTKNFKNNLNLNYDFNVSKNLDKIIKNEINANYDYDKNSFNVSFYEINRTLNTHYISGTYNRSFENNINFLIGAKKNLEQDFSENNFIEINYDSDCLKFGLNISKSFYQNDDLQNSNNIALFLVLKPFGQPFAPNLNNLVD